MDIEISETDIPQDVRIEVVADVIPENTVNVNLSPLPENASPESVLSHSDVITSEISDQIVPDVTLTSVQSTQDIQNCASDGKDVTEDAKTVGTNVRDIQKLTDGLGNDVQGIAPYLFIGHWWYVFASH